MPSPSDISNIYRNRFLRNQATFERKYKSIFDKVIEQFTSLVYDPNIKFAKAFKFPDYINKRVDGFMTDFHNQVLEMNEQEIEKAWNLSNGKNDEIVSDYLKSIKAIKEAQKAAYYLPNVSALKAFISSERYEAGKLSDAVWKIGEQLRAEMTLHLGIGLTNGDSAQVISRRIRQYLNNPDALFRRVRDVNGKLVPSREMLNYHPGQGVYRSAYKNAIRLTRSNTNQSYLLSDHLRWQKLDMVKGIRISLSEQHPDYNFEEICETLEGIYPKDFDWSGWHPQCLCHATPILSSSEDFFRYLQTGQREVNGMVQDYPENFKKYVASNYERYQGYKSQPYWMADNKSLIDKLYYEKTGVRNLMTRAKESAPELYNISQRYADKYKGISTPANLKSEARILEKAKNDYNGDISRIKDTVRTTVIVPESQMGNILKDLESDGRFTVKVQTPDKFMGYSGILTNIETKNGLVAEMQANTAKMIYAKEKESSARAILGDDIYNKISKATGIEGGLGHKYYEEFRTLEGDIKSLVGDELRAAQTRMNELEKLSREYYEIFR